MYVTFYDSPVGNIVMYSDGRHLTGLYFRDDRSETEEYCPLFNEVKEWLDIYFKGEEPDFTPPYILEGTVFQKEVWSRLEKVPYGKTVSYGDIAKDIAEKRGIRKMSAQAVGQAVGSNPVSIIVPCHRVLGSDGSLTGYGGGLDKKTYLLRLEGIDNE